MYKNGKNSFYRKLKLDKTTRKAIQLFSEFQHQVIRDAEYFDLSKTDEGEEPR